MVKDLTLSIKEEINFANDLKNNTNNFDFIVDNVAEWLKRRTHDQHSLGSKPTRAILLCLWERHFTAHSPAWWLVLASSSKLQSYLY